MCLVRHLALQNACRAGTGPQVDFPTEGGLFCGIAEMAIASETGVFIEEERINVLPEPLELSNVYNLNPMGTISSGSLLITLSNENEDSSKLIDILTKNNILAKKIGNIVDKKEGLMIKRKDGKIQPLKYSETDEIIKIF